MGWGFGGLTNKGFIEVTWRFKGGEPCRYLGKNTQRRASAKALKSRVRLVTRRKSRAASEE